MSVRHAAAMSFKRSTGRQVLSVVVENVRVLLIPRGRSAMVACTRRWCGAPSIVPDGHEAAEGGRQVVAEISGEVLACAFRRRLATDGLRETGGCTNATVRQRAAIFVDYFAPLR